jgi:hypothetical protein
MPRLNAFSVTPKFTVVVDTDSYAGAFEREMCAYITGQTGECGVGKDYAEFAYSSNVQPGHKALSKRDQTWFESHSQPLLGAKDGDCYRPVSIARTPGARPRNGHSEAFHSVEMFFDKQPSGTLFKTMTTRAYKFVELFRQRGEGTITVIGVRLVEHEVIINETTLRG